MKAFADLDEREVLIFYFNEFVKEVASDDVKMALNM